MTTVTDHLCEDFVNETEDVLQYMNGDLRRICRDYFRKHKVFVSEKNMYISITLVLAVEEVVEWRFMEMDQVKHFRLGAEVTSLPVEEIVVSKQHIDPAPHNFSRQSHTPHLFKLYSDNDDKYSGDPKDNFDKKYSYFQDDVTKLRLKVTTIDERHSRSC